MRTRLLVFLFALCLLENSARADLIINLYPDGGGGVAGDAEGAFGVFTSSNYTEVDLSGIGEDLTRLSFPGGDSTRTELSFSEFTGLGVVGFYYYIFDATKGAGNPIATTPQPSISNVLPLALPGQLNLSAAYNPAAPGDSDHRVFVPVGSPVPEPSVFSATFAMPTWSFSEFNLGTWEWGTFDGSGTDGIQLNILAAAPSSNVPSSGTTVLMLGMGLLGLAGARRLRRA